MKAQNLLKLLEGRVIKVSIPDTDVFTIYVADKQYYIYPDDNYKIYGFLYATRKELTEIFGKPSYMIYKNPAWDFLITPNESVPVSIINKEGAWVIIGKPKENKTREIAQDIIKFVKYKQSKTKEIELPKSVKPKVDIE